jgi:hypothetical protein
VAQDEFGDISFFRSCDTTSSSFLTSYIVVIAKDIDDSFANRNRLQGETDRLIAKNIKVIIFVFKHGIRIRKRREREKKRK